MAQYPPQVQQPPTAYQGAPNYAPAQQPVMMATVPPQQQMVQPQPVATAPPHPAEPTTAVVHESSQSSDSETPAKHEEMRQQILAEMGQVRKLQSQLVVAEAKKRARAEPAKKLSTHKQEAKEFLHTQVSSLQKDSSISG
jgi:hypothetical protein